VADISYSAGNEGQRYLILSFPARIPPASISTPRRARPRILAIDDQEVIRELLASMLEELDYPHQICGDGRSGLEAFMRGGFDIVVTDLGLPDLDGWDLVRKIKESRPDTPVIVITGWGLDAERRKALGQLADYILSKPFRMEQLGEMILAAESRRMALP